MFSQPPSITYNDILMVAMPHILALKETSIQFAKFFVDSPNSDSNVYNPSTRMTHSLKGEDLPSFACQSLEMKNFTDKTKDQYKDILKFVRSFIKDNATNLDLADIPVKHFCVDFRSQILQIKLSQYCKGEDVSDPWAQSDLQIAKFTQHIVTKYGKEIEFQQSTRNLIDELFERKTKFNYTLQLIFFLVGYVLPLYLEIFHAGEDENYRWICLIVCLVTICFFTLHAVL